MAFGQFGGPFLPDASTAPAPTFDALRMTQYALEVAVSAAPPPAPPNPPRYGDVVSAEQPNAGTSLCGATTPLLFCELQNDSSSTFYAWIDQPLNDATSQKEPRILNVSTLRRALSDWNGRYDVAHGDVTLWDADGDTRSRGSSLRTST